MSKRHSESYLIHCFPKKTNAFSMTNLPLERVKTELVQPPNYKIVLNSQARLLLMKAQSKSEYVELGQISESTQGLAGNKFKPIASSRANDNQVFPFVKNGPTLPTQERLVSLVNDVLSAKKKDPNADTRALETQIDLMVYKLYGLTWPEVKIVDPEFAMPEAEYKNLQFDFQEA